jgi:hypothetical protein
MKITYGGYIVVAGDNPAGSTGSGLTISVQQQVQLAAYLRGSYQKPFARKNRTQTVDFMVHMAGSDNEALAMKEMLTWFAALPNEGDLVFEEGGEIVTFAGAVFTGASPVRPRNGISNQFKLAFAVMAPDTSEALVDDDDECLIAD